MSIPQHQCFYGLIYKFSKSNVQVHLENITVEADTCGNIAQNKISFKYKKFNFDVQNCKFIFPVNSTSAVYFLQCNINGRKITGKVFEREKAQDKYDQALTEGKQAVLVAEKKNASDILELNIGNVNAEESPVIIIKEVFEMPLIKKTSRNTCSFLYKFPTSLFLRYGEIRTADETTPQCYNFKFKLTDHGFVDKISPRGWIGKSNQGDVVKNTGSVLEFQQLQYYPTELVGKGVFQKDHDVLFHLDVSEANILEKGYRIVERWMKSNGQGTEKYITMSSKLIKVPSIAVSSLPPKSYCFLIDCSGSMMGQRIVNAKRTLQQLVNSLPSGSSFSVIKFGSTGRENETGKI